MRPRVLVVDDDDAIRHLLIAVLERAGFAVDEARHGGEAIERIKTNAYGILIVDLMMPVHSGYDLLDWLTENDPALLSCVIVISAVGEPDISRLDRDAVFRILSKPFDLDLILAAAEECEARPR